MSLITTDFTNDQNKVFYYQQSLKSEEFNRIFSKTLPLGIYEGGKFTRLNDTSFTIDPFSVVIDDRNENDISVRIRIMNTLTATIANSLDYPLIVARFSWTTGVEKSLEIIQVSETVGTGELELNSTDLILGKINLVDNSGTISLESSSFFADYTRKNWSTLTRDVLKNSLFVRAAKESEDKTKVYVESGTLRAKTGILEIIGSSSPSISATSFSRIDYIYIDELGAIKVQEGSVSGLSEPFYGRKVVAEIRRSSGRSTIFGSEIFNFNEVPFGTINADTLTIENSESYFSGSKISIEESLKQVWEKSIRSLIDGTDPDELVQKTFRHVDGLKVESGENKNAIIIKPKNVGTTNRTLTLTNITLSADRTIILPNGDVEILAGTQLTLANINQTIDGVKTFKKLPQLTTDGINPLVATLDTDATPFKQVKDFQASLTTLEGTGTPQGVGTGDSPTFANATIAGHNVDTKLDNSVSHIANTSNPHNLSKEQIVGLKATDSVTFVALHGRVYFT